MRMRRSRLYTNGTIHALKQTHKPSCILFRRFSDSSSKYLSRSTYADTLEPIERATGLIPEAYTDDEFNKLEREKVFRRAWIAVDMDAGRLSRHGDVLSTRVAGIPILITNNNGELNAFYNICRHRASILLEEGVHRDCAAIRCPYHSWVYSPGGELVRTPFFNDDKMPSNSTQRSDPTKKAEIFQYTKMVDFNPKDYGLFAVGVESFMGALFVNLDPDKQRRDLLWKYQFGDLSQHYGHFPYDDMKIVHQENFEINANWKLIMENTNDYYHSFTIHPELLEYSSTANHISRQGVGQYQGVATYPVTQSGTPADPDKFPHFKGINETDKAAAWFIHIFPNIDYFLMPHHILTLITQPHPEKAAQCTEKLSIMFDKDLDHENKYAEKIKELLVFWGRVNNQDIDAVQLAQKGLQHATHIYRGGRISAKFEDAFYRFQHTLIDYMTDEYMKEYPGDPDFVPFHQLPRYHL